MMGSQCRVKSVSKNNHRVFEGKYQCIPGNVGQGGGGVYLGSVSIWVVNVKNRP